MTTIIGTKTITDSYNATGTRASRVYGFTTPYTVAMTYLAGTNGSKTAVLSTYRNGSETAYSYAYDDNGNITSITRGSVSATYVYDQMNQLVRANDGFANITTTYTYDLGGNITQRNEYAYTTGALGTPTDTVSYTYDSTWADKLVGYDGQSITYDSLGNPLTYRDYVLTWEGKRLQTLSGNGTSASYTYDEQGIRTSKTVNDVTTSYDYNGSLLMAQTTGNGTGQIKQLYSYDASGQLVSVNYNGTEYFYLRNGQNDIVGLMDSNGTRVVEYTYDSWGKLVSTTGTLATTLGANNPFRYRGYYYDAETGLYYLQTRYYDPEVCRFISADVYMSTGQGIVGNNMFAYCLNNPITFCDDQGNLAILLSMLAGAVIGAAVSFIANGISNVANGGNFCDNWGVAVISGAVSGALAGTGLPVLAQTIGNAAISAGVNIYTQLTTKPKEEFSMTDLLYDTAAGAVAGVIGGGGANAAANGTQILNATFGTAAKIIGFKPAAKEVIKAIIKSSVRAGEITVAKTIAGIVKALIK